MDKVERLEWAIELVIDLRHDEIVEVEKQNLKDLEQTLTWVCEFLREGHMKVGERVP